MVDTLSTPHGHVPHDDAATVQGTPRGSVHGEKGEKKGSDLDITTEPIARPEADQDPESGDKLHRGLKYVSLSLSRLCAAHLSLTIVSQESVCTC